ncbi:hypothetical protein GBAR_LOCUS16922 [Geodia barretti]|uniref:Uncharacterized protein n=1 Tax=Geodia barretti TaxID=519541 RepID=A0AA35WUX9_GEOBA|nr:hypothetical protein GBAR_LOCUS16922 [Geodia barretti]
MALTSNSLSGLHCFEHSHILDWAGPLSETFPSETQPTLPARERLLLEAASLPSSFLLPASTGTSLATMPSPFSLTGIGDSLTSR